MKRILSPLFILTCLTGFSQYYWVGGSGNWSEFSTHWATSSGGSTFHTTVPSTSDDVFFDANSFTAASQTVTVDEAIMGNNIDFTGSTNNPTILVSVNTSIAGNLTLIDAMAYSGTGTLNFTGSGNVTFNTGSAAKTLPDLSFPNATGDVRILTSETTNTTDRISFGNITLSQANVDFFLDTDRSCSVKTFGDLTLPANCDYNINGPHGSGFQAANRNIMTGTLTVGINGDGRVRGHYFDFQGNMIFGTGTDINFQDRVELTGTTMTVASTAQNHIIFGHRSEVDNNIIFNGDATMRVDRRADFDGTISVAASSTLNINQNSGESGDPRFSTDFTLGTSATVNVGDGTNSADYTFADIIMNQSSELIFNNGTGPVNIDNLTVGAFAIVQFNSSSSGTTFSGSLNSTGDCSNWRFLKSNSLGDPASLNTSGSQAGISFNTIRDITVSSGSLISTDGIDNGGNTNITFNSNHSSATLYWRGGNTGNWSDGALWSTTYTPTTVANCVPGSLDNAIFDDMSFAPGSPSITMDLDQAFVNNMTWTSPTNSPTWEGSASNELIVFGDFTFDGANATNNFLGLTKFTMGSAGTNNITMNGGAFVGDVLFDFGGGQWDLQDAMDVNGAGSDMVIENGILNAGANAITLESNWTVNSGGTFTPGTGTVTFDDQTANDDQQIIMNGSSFYNLGINRGGNNRVVDLNDAITIANDLTIDVGRLYDNGNQITGNATGTLTMASNTIMRVGNNGTATMFPTLFTNVSLHNRSIIEYRSRQNQDVAGNITYGRIYLNGGGTTSRTKTLQGPITIQREIRIQSRNDFLDNGHQITGTSGRTFRMDGNSSFTIGTQTTTTQFPTLFTNFNINANSTITYASGQDDLQTIKDLNAGGNASYANLVLTNASGTMRTKNLDGNIEVRGNLLVENANTLDVTASQHTLDVQGNITLTGTGTINFRNTTLTMDGTSQQTINFGGNTGNVHNLIINNASGVLLDDNIDLTGSIDLQNGILAPVASEVVTLQDGATVISVSDASFVNGTVEKIGNDPFTFPVGAGSSYRPISISAPGTITDAFSASYVASSPDPTYDRSMKDVAIENVSGLEYWFLDVTNGTPTVNVTLSWNAASDVGNLPTLLVGHWSGSQWDNYGNDGTTGNTTAGTITVNSISTFSPFTLASSGDNPLPVELLKFKVEENESSALLSWTTATELNNEYFSIQRSGDGANWSLIGEIAGNGTTNEAQVYQFLDYSPLPGLSFYRLEQFDFDGKSELLPTASFENSNEIAISIFPNPTSDLLNIVGVENTTEISFLDSRGHILNVPLINRVASLRSLPSGVYILVVRTPLQSFRHRILLNH